MRDDPIIKALDAAAELTGIPALSRRFQDGDFKRPRRWMPIFVLTLGAIGLIFVGVTSRIYTGYFCIAISLSMTGMVELFGPLKPLFPSDDVDEFDRNLRVRAHSATMPVIVMYALLVMILTPLAFAAEFWTAQKMAWTLLSAAIYLIVLWGTLPTLFASWMVRPVKGDDY